MVKSLQFEKKKLADDSVKKFEVNSNQIRFLEVRKRKVGLVRCYFFLPFSIITISIPMLMSTNKQRKEYGVLYESFSYT